MSEDFDSEAARFLQDGKIAEFNRRRKQHKEFQDLKLKNLDIKDANLERVDLHKGNLEGSFFSNIYLKGADLRDCNISGSISYQLQYGKCQFRGCTGMGYQFGKRENESG